MQLPQDPRFKQGIYRPKHPEKFIGKHAVYRSSFELRFMQWADRNTNVLEWSSEQIIVPYISPVDGRAHRYYVDNFVIIKEGEQIKKYLIEIKPSKQTVPPVTKYKKKEHLIYEQSMYIKNQAKWQAATEFCKKKGLEFLILTEKHLK